MRTVLDTQAVTLGLRRVANEIVERHGGTTGLVLVGIRRGGVAVADELQKLLLEHSGESIPLGTVDITLYRDDAATALPSPRIGPSEIPCRLEGKRVILVDDVAFTGRTVRAAIDALFDFGRPKSIELAVVVERPGRELPIQPDYKVRSIEVGPRERVDVVRDSSGLYAVVSALDAPSIPPPA
jgi:pyrimidine operon attenuation protein/uracil phosphoribosyltransferase